MDNDTVEVINKDLNAALQLSSTDKKWINGLVDSVKNTWDPDDHWGPKDFGFKGSEDYIRLQFEEYLMFLLSSVKYDSFLSKQTVPLSALQARPNITGNPLKLFNMSWVELWKRTNNYRIFNKFTDGELFDIVEPRHPGENNGELGQKDGFGKSVTKAFGNLWNKEEKQKDTRGNYGKELHTATSSKEPSLSSRNPSIISRTASIGAVSMQSIVDEPNTPFYESPSPIGKPEGHRSMSSVASDISSVSSGAKDLTPSRTTTGYFSSWSSWAADKRKNLFAKKIVSEVPDENLNSTEGSIKSIDLSRD